MNRYAILPQLTFTSHTVAA